MTPTPFYREADYNPGVPTLRGTLGFDHGERLCGTEEIGRYCAALAGEGRVAEPVLAG